MPRIGRSTHPCLAIPLLRNCRSEVDPRGVDLLPGNAPEGQRDAALVTVVGRLRRKGF